MPRRLLLVATFVLGVSACTQVPSPAAPSPTPDAAAAAAATPEEASMPTDATATAPPPATGGIEGAIRDGNRPSPALRICARPSRGGSPTCVDSAAGATSYRIALTAGRYVVSGQALDDPASRFAHATRIRCIRPPCPPDQLIEVAVAAGETRTGIDLSVGEALPPG